MARILLLLMVLLTIHVASARGITPQELVGTWLMGTSGDGDITGTFREDSTFRISHGKLPFADGTWKLSDEGSKLRMTDSATQTGDITIIRKFDGRLLQITVSNGVEGAWKKVRKVRHSAHRPAKT